MDFLISGTHIAAFYLIGVGFFIGLLGGFFGVGGSFLAGPALFAMGMPMNFVVGTDLSHIVGKSIVATRTHRALGNVDTKLGLIMAVGTIVGVETGAQCIQYLKRHSNVDTVVAIGYLIVLVSISLFMGWESWHTWNTQKKLSGQQEEDASLGSVSKKLHSFSLAPMISLPDSGIEQVSLWVILGVAYLGGIFSGFLGGGAGYIRMPAMVFLLGVPTHVAVGTDLFEIVISASYGTLTHAIKGNVDILVALVMHIGSAVGAQIGATMTEQFEGRRIRLAFVPLPLIGAVLVIFSLMTGKHFK